MKPALLALAMTFAHAAACGDNESGGSGGGTTGTTTSAPQTSSRATTTTKATSGSTTTGAPVDCAMYASADECPGPPCYWTEGFMFDESDDVCPGGNQQLACSAGTPIGRCIYEDDDAFAQAPYYIFRSAGSSIEVVQFPMIPFDNDIPGWMMCSSDQPCQEWPPQP